MMQSISCYENVAESIDSDISEVIERTSDAMQKQKEHMKNNLEKHRCCLRKFDEHLEKAKTYFTKGRAERGFCEELGFRNRIEAGIQEYKVCRKPYEDLIDTFQELVEKSASTESVMEYCWIHLPELRNMIQELNKASEEFGVMGNGIFREFHEYYVKVEEAIAEMLDSDW